MIPLLLCKLALAHGGVDDEPHPPPAAAPTADAISAAASTKAFDAVIRVHRVPAGEPALTTLLLADWATDAPVSGATASLALSGPATVGVDLTPAQDPGIYSGTATFPAPGNYAGALVVTTPSASDLLSITALDTTPPPPAPGTSPAWAIAGVLGALGLAGGAAIVGVGVGFALGRWRRGVAGAALVVVLGASDDRSRAHGGVDDEPHPGAAAAPPGGALVLPMESQFLLGMRTEPLVMAPFHDQVRAAGTFVSRPGESATLRAPIGGVITAPPGGFPSPGQEVRAGDLLAVVQASAGSADRAAVASQRSAAAVEVAEAKKALTLAERDQAQVAALGSSLSDRERLEREQSVEVARTRVHQAEGALAAIGNGATVAIRAPVAGRLGPAVARPGDQVEEGQSLFRVVDPRGLWLEVRVPEREAVGLEPGATAEVRSEALPGATLAATVLDAGQEADPSTGTVTATLAVDDEGRGLRPGMGATAWIGRGAGRDALVVPDAAVVDSNGETLAFVKTGPESFELRPVALGGHAAGIWEVRAGLRAGERVVVEGTYTLRSLAGR